MMGKLRTERKVKNEIDRLMLFVKHDKDFAKLIAKKDLFRILSKLHPIFNKRYMEYFEKYAEEMNREKITKFGNIKYVHRIRDLETLWEIFSLRDYDLLKNFVPKQGDIILEAGAGIGEFTMIAAGMIGNEGRIIGIEPNKKSYSYLKRNVKLNKKSNVTPVNMAVSDKGGKIKIFNIPGTSIIDSIISEWAGTNRFYLVNSTTIDGLVKKFGLEKLNIIKMDVEGAEYLALVGAKKSLKKLKPRIMMEIHSEKIRKQVTGLLKKVGYKIELEKVKNTSPFISLIYASPKVARNGKM